MAFESSLLDSSSGPEESDATSELEDFGIEVKFE